MFNKISPLILSVLLLLVLSGNANNLPVLAVSFLALVLGSVYLNYRRFKLAWPHLLLPVLFLTGVFSIYTIVSTQWLKITFTLISVLSFYFLEKHLGKESHFLQNIYLFSAFSIFTGMFAAQFYFNLNHWFLTLLVFFVSYLLIAQGFAGFVLPSKRYFSFLTALVCSEIALGIAFWPTHFLVDAVILFCSFYLLWIFAFSAFFGKLTMKKIYWQLIMVLFVLLATLTSAQWKPLVR